MGDFSVVLFRPKCMLVSEEHPMNTQKHQTRVTLLSPLDLPWGATNQADFSVVLFRSDFVLVSEKNHVKMHKNQWLLTSLSPLDIPCRAKNPGIPHGV